MWTTLAATVVLAGWAISTRGWYGGWAGASGRWIGLYDGAFSCGRVSSAGGAQGWMTGSLLTPSSTLWWSYRSSSTDWELWISLWLPAGATFVVSTISAFMVSRTRRRPGHCRKCGYDRSGLPTDAPCPECGLARAS